MLTTADVIHLERDSHGAEVMIVVLPGTSFIFLWFGGAYIDVLRESGVGTYKINGRWYGFTDRNINVWDYLTDTPTIRMGDKEGLVSTINEFLESD